MARGEVIRGDGERILANDEHTGARAGQVVRS